VLREPSTAYVVVTSGQAEPVAEATYFIGELESANVVVSLIVANRLMPHFGDADDSLPASLVDNLRELADERRAEESNLMALSTARPDTPWIHVPLVSELVDERLDTLAALRLLGRALGDAD
jgi:anion-transporting  ArsA/GET3 family ATPase